MEAWKPARERGNVRIRVLEIHPLPWYLRWIPQSWESYIGIRASLAWAPLPEVTITRKELVDAGVDKAASARDTADNLHDKKTSISNSSTPDTEKTDETRCTPSSCKWSPPYKALSYTWGDGKTTSDVLVNGKKLTITLSLATALYHLRPRSKPLRIWIDQISINQQDLQEKTEQVQHMDRVYRNAEESLVWLGPAQSGSDALMDLLNKLGAFAECFGLYSYYTKAKYPELFAIETKKNPEDPRTIEYHAFTDSVTNDFTYSFFESLIAFYELPYFQRAWCVQEFSLPPRVIFVYGTKRINAETLMCVLQMIVLTISTNIIKLQPNNRPLMALFERWGEIMDSTMTPFFSSRQRRKQWDSGERKGDSLYDILQRVCVSGAIRATQGCDMVYGLLGLVNDAERLRIRAEYSEADHQKQAAFTYMKTARALIQSGKVDLLVFAQHVKTDMTLPTWVPDWRSGLKHSFAESNKQEKIDGLAIAMCRKMEQDAILPSWVPDWRVRLRRSFAWLSDADKDPLFQASHKQPLILHDEGDDRVLALDGYIVDDIEDTGGPWTGGQRVVDGSSSRFPHEEFLNLLAQIRQMCLVSKAKGNFIYNTSEEADGAYWRVPCGGLDQDESFTAMKGGPALKLKYEHCIAELELLIQVYGMTMVEYEARAAELVEMGKRKADDEDPGCNTGSLYRVRMQEMSGKRPFISKVGYVGMGPGCMRMGDKIAILNGASVPFIIRPVDEDRFRLMGECYCDGIMFGEFIQRGAQVRKMVLV